MGEEKTINEAKEICYEIEKISNLCKKHVLLEL